MPLELQVTPLSVESGTWNLIGTPNRLLAVSDDSDSTGISVRGDQAQTPSSFVEAWAFEWDAADLPAGSYIVGYRLVARVRGYDSVGGAAYSNAIRLIIDLPGQQTQGTITSVPATFAARDYVRTITPVAKPASGTLTMGGGLRPETGVPNDLQSGVIASEVRGALRYSIPPNAPVITSPAAGGTTGAVPRFEGTFSSPTNDTLGRVRLEVRQASNNALVWSTEFNASGSTWARDYAGPTLTPGVTYKVRAGCRSAELSTVWGAWSDYVEFTPQFNAPPIVSLISPSDGANVSTPTPTFSWSYSDPNGDPQGHYQIQVRPQNGAVSWDTGQVAGSQNSRVYAGPALVEGQPMEVRVRAWDTQGAASEYTPWRLFTYAPKPNPPTLTIDPLVDSLTFTIAGSYNQGGGDAEAGYYYELRQSGITIYQSGLVTGNLATGQAYGTVNPLGTPSTPPPLSWGTDYQIRAKSRDVAGRESDWSGWLPIRTQSPPTTPTNLSPNGALIGTTRPTLSWQHNDPDGDEQSAYYIELWEVDSGDPVSGYPKSVSSSSQSHTVDTDLTDTPATEYSWRVATTGSPGAGQGPLSSVATFTVAVAPQLSVTSPTPSQVVTAPGLVVSWEITGGGSGVQQSFRVRVYAADQATVLHDSGTTGSVADQYAIPLGVLQNNGAYYVRVNVTDTLNLTADSGLIPITTSWTPPSTITGLFAQAIGDQADGMGVEQNPLPNIYLTWDESPEPVNSFLRYVIYRREVGDSEWEWMANITDRGLTSYNDYTVASDTLYEYIVLVVADVAGEEVESEPPTPAQQQLTIRSAFAHVRGMESIYIELAAQTQAVTPEQDIAYVQPRRSRAPVAHVGGKLAGVFELTVTDAWDRDQWRRVRALQEAQANGRVLMLRQHRDVCAYVVLESVTRSDQTTLMGLRLRFREVEAPEGV